MANKASEVDWPDAVDRYCLVSWELVEQDSEHTVLAPLAGGLSQRPQPKPLLSWGGATSKITRVIVGRTQIFWAVGWSPSFACLVDYKRGS